MPATQKFTDALLLKRIADGDMRAYEELFTRYYPTLCAYARLFVRGGGN